MSYRYEWSWQWEANRISVWDIDPSILLAELEVKIRNQLRLRPEITAIESIRHANIKHWTEALINRRYSGITVVTFLSTIPHEPIPVAIIALLQLVVIAIIVAMIAFAIVTVASTVKEIVTAAPAGLGSLALLAVIGLGIYAWMKTKERK